MIFLHEVMMLHYELNAVLRDFSLSDNNSIWKVSYNSVKYDLQYSYLSNIHLRFFANGNHTENNGYVSIILWEGDFTNIIDVRYFFSVLDASGNKRFTQSFIYIKDMVAPPHITKGSSGKSDFGLQRYLKREILLNDPDELLPGDCLTIFMEIDYTPLSYDQKVDHFSSPNVLVELLPSVHLQNILQVNCVLLDIKRKCINKFFFIDRCGRVCIPLDTFYGRKLCSSSGFFQRAYETPLTEGTVRKVHIPNVELLAFSNIFNILFIPHTDLAVESIEHICQLYVIADKYDFQPVTETCRQLIKAFLCTTEDSGVWEHSNQSIPDIIELANKYGDSDLIDTVETYLESKESFGSRHNDLGKYLKRIFFTEWKCVSRRDQLGDIYQYTLSRITGPEFEFYL